MNHQQQLASVRRWFTQHKGIINISKLAVRIRIPATTLARAVTEDVEQQRNVSPEFLKLITDTLTGLNFNPKIDYAKAN